MKEIAIKSDSERFFKQLMKILHGMPPINKLNGKQIEVLSEIMYQYNKYVGYPEDDKLSIIFSKAGRDNMCERLNMDRNIFNNNLSFLRKHGMLDKDGRLKKFFSDIVFDGKFSLTFTFKE